MEIEIKVPTENKTEYNTKEEFAMTCKSVVNFTDKQKKRKSASVRDSRDCSICSRNVSPFQSMYLDFGENNSKQAVPICTAVFRHRCLVKRHFIEMPIYCERMRERRDAFREKSQQRLKTKEKKVSDP